MIGQNKRYSWLAGASTWVLLAVIGSAYAQTPPQPTRDEAAQEIIERTQDEQDQQKSRPQPKEKQLDTEAAAESLAGSGSKVLSKLPSRENLNRLAALIQAQPNNLDHYFAYARMASQLGRYEQAAKAYEMMLALAPQLHRVRLDLGATYLRLGRLEEARAQLEKVLQTNPPKQVEANVETILARIDGELREHHWQGNITVGMNYDSNSSSAPDSDTILLFDTVQDLAPAQQQQSDPQFFTSAGLSHEYRPQWARSEHFYRKWKTDLTFYESEQSTLDSLDLRFISLKTGPVFRSLQSGIEVSPKIGYNHIVLATHTYLRSLSAEFAAEFPVADWLVLTFDARHEFRDFENAPDVTIYEDRTGSATQFALGGRVIFGDSDFLTLSLTSRRERTRVEYYDNEQLAANLTYTHLLPDGFFGRAALGYRNTVYDNPDFLISSQTRHDKQRTFALTLGKRFTESITGTVGYQYRDTRSNILNYDYENHRLSGSLSWRF